MAKNGRIEKVVLELFLRGGSRTAVRLDDREHYSCDYVLGKSSDLLSSWHRELEIR